jgi:mRNA-degrading endonuclease RelE of RelBE toxin-antitoxin system
MKYRISKSFVKKVRKNSNKKLAESILAVIENVSKAKDISEINNLKKLKDYANYYRIRGGV